MAGDPLAAVDRLDHPSTVNDSDARTGAVVAQRRLARLHPRTWFTPFSFLLAPGGAT